MRCWRRVQAAFRRGQGLADPRGNNPTRPQQARAGPLSPLRALGNTREPKAPATDRNHPRQPLLPANTHAREHAQPSPRPSDRKQLQAFPVLSCLMVASVMSWVQAATSGRSHREEGDVFDEEADESLLVQREWRNHMQRRVKVKLRGGRGGPLICGVVGSCEEAGSGGSRPE